MPSFLLHPRGVPCSPIFSSSSSPLRAATVVAAMTIPTGHDTWTSSRTVDGGTGAANVLPPRGPPAYPLARSNHHPFLTPPFAAAASATSSAGPDTWTPRRRPPTGAGNLSPWGHPAAGESASSPWRTSAPPPAAPRAVHDALIGEEIERGARVDALMRPPLSGGLPVRPVHMPWSTAAAAPAAAASSSHFQPRKYALLVGINYWGNHFMPTLRGCVADVRNVRRLLTSRCGYDPADIVTLTDEPLDGIGGAWGKFPTHDAILAEMRALVAKPKAGDSLFFHFSGHGAQEPDASGDEIDGMDETFVPADGTPTGRTILDDNVHKLLVKALPPGVRLMALIDACHSATALDLPHLLDEPWGAGHGCDAACGTEKGCGGDRVISLGACRDDSAAADWHRAGRGTSSAGAMTSFFIDAVERNVGGTTHRAVLNYVRRRILEEGMTQEPQLSSSSPLDPYARLEL